MSVLNLNALFEPRSIAILGASDRANTVGAILVQNLLGGGFRGTIYPINPKYDHVQGLPCLARPADLPSPPDLGLIAIPAQFVAEAVDELAAQGTRAVVVISAGFREIGPAGVALEAQLAGLRTKYEGLRILGPNCLGFIIPRLNLNASFASGSLKAGRVAFVSQSGALCTAVLDWARSEDIGFSLFASLGNALDVGFADIIDYLSDDGYTEGIVLYVESIARARDFLSAARAFTRRKPIVVYKSGRCQESARAAASHTGAVAGLDVAYDAAFRRAAIVRVHDSRELVNCAEALARCPLPAGLRLAILTNAGGPGVMAIDALADCHGEVASLSAATIEQLNAVLPPFWPHCNPVDVLGDAPPERYAAAARALIVDEQVDGIVAILTPQAMTAPAKTAEQLVEAVVAVRKPTLAVWMGGTSVAAGRDILQEHGIATFETPEDAVRAFSHLAEYARGLTLLQEVPRAIPLSLPESSSQRRDRAEALLAGKARMLDECASKQLLDVYGIPNSACKIARDEDAAARLGTEIGFPVVMKIHSPDISHKSDVEGVRTNVQTAAEARCAFGEILANVRARCPAAHLEGVSVQSHVAPLYGLEMILGCRRDPTFGPVMMVGLGGTTVEIMRDCAFELPPLNERFCRRLLEALRVWPILCGYRGRPPLAVDGLVEVMLRFSTMIVECAQIDEIDLNPLLVTPKATIALDARVTLTESLEPGRRPTGHLAIAPYPDQWIRTVRLQDGSQVVLRPIQPEDEPFWHEMLDASSEQTILSRFRSLFRSVVHRQAARYCSIDYDREMAFVAEVQQGSHTQLVAVGRLAADVTHEAMEFGILVIDSWQHRGLGGMLLDLCLEYARSLDCRKVYADTAWDNRPMLALFRTRGFRLTHFPHDPTTLRATLQS